MALAPELAMALLGGALVLVGLAFLPRGAGRRGGRKGDGGAVVADSGGRKDNDDASGDGDGGGDGGGGGD
ncbi:MAG: hypothetical protein NW200_07775 [Hyphomonadaceae bacterium]|nr:hypothetical protein [Hyphomonadaceae bacterium]